MKPYACAAIVAALSVIPAAAQVPQLLNAQGRISVANVNFNGNGTFRFAIVNATGNTTYWSNDGTSANGSEPTAGVTVAVDNGHYSLLLGDTSLTNMNALSTSVFQNSSIFLRVWFDDGVNGSELLTPDKQIVASGYALLSKQVEDGAIGTDQLAGGSVTGAKIAPNSITSANILNGTITDADILDNTITSSKVADNFDFGSTTANGFVSVWDSGLDLEAIQLDGNQSSITTFGSDGLIQTRLWGASWGELQLYDGSASNNLTVDINAGFFTASSPSIALSAGSDQMVFMNANTSVGGNLLLYQPDGDSGINLSGNFGGAGFMTVFQADNMPGIELDGVGNDITLYQDDDEVGLMLTSGASGAISVRDSDGTTGVAVSGASNSITLYADDGSTPVYMTGESGGAGLIQVRNNTSNTRVTLDGEDSNGGGLMTLGDASGTTTVRIQGAQASNEGGVITLYEDDGSITAVLRQDTSSERGGELLLYDGSGADRVVIEASEAGTDGAQIALKNAAGATTLTLDAEHGIGGASRVITGTVQITGGSDLSEQFAVNPSATALTPEPGMLVSIDPDDPGALKPSSTPYDRKVAGIISGAGGIHTGMLMGQVGTIANGEHPVALTGRVYCKVDTCNGPIEPGDLITTSPTPGHGMRVTDHATAQGAIIGKAMTSLEEDTGLVLVLVSLQ